MGFFTTYRDLHSVSDVLSAIASQYHNWVKNRAEVRRACPPSTGCARALSESASLGIVALMAMADRLLDAMASSASRLYGGEPVTELAHALQCADLAREAGAGEELVLACLLHDVGRYAVDQGLVLDTMEGACRAGPGARGHHEMGAELIAPYVPTRVAWLVRMHADAKRYLCASEPAYYDTLTPASRRTLQLQGGVMESDEARRLSTHPWLADALALRRWDDQAKVTGKPTRPLLAWEALLRKYFTEARASAG